MKKSWEDDSQNNKRINYNAEYKWNCKQTSVQLGTNNRSTENPESNAKSIQEGTDFDMIRQKKKLSHKNH